jgi:anti-sigma regulatory factor (Ser/Thr protein kinase)
VQDLLSADGCSSDDLDLVLLLTSELVTNAVRHGAPPIGLRVQHCGASLRVEVRDAGDAFGPGWTLAEDLTAEGGRGLALVEALATSWGCLAQDDLTIGKTVWFEVVQGASSPAASR